MSVDQDLARLASSDIDAVVIGGGPAGAAAATALAREACNVVVLERANFPRFHIGESMLTYMAKTAERIGLTERLDSEGFTVKTGAEFTRDDGRVVRVDFTAQGGGRRETTYQVERADFDKLFLDHARDLGATVIHGARVRRIAQEPGGPVTGVVATADGGGEGEHLIPARYVIDASGRAGVLVHRHLAARRPNPRLDRVALFRHFTDVDPATDQGEPGDIVIGTHADGWVWAIPIRPGMLSVGVVTGSEVLQGRDSQEVFDEHVRRIPRIAPRLEGATVVGEQSAESGFSYWSDTVAGPGFFAAGDAGCFVDPIFSAGVYLGMITGLAAGDAVVSILNDLRDEATVQEEYSRLYKTGYDTYLRLIYGFYEHDFVLGNLLKASGQRVSERTLARLLGGDFWSPDNQLAAYLRTREDFATFAPFEPLLQCPVYPDATDDEVDASAVAGAGSS